ncbi:MAG: rhomboid family intramembrane serine protease [Flavobacteriaceae bacterium]|nr:rhomboid family intramembrane serine protease [Flavobacteriaceae bacterium]
MNNWEKIKFKYDQFSISEKLITINIILFIIPFILSTFIFLFNLSFDNFIYWVELSPRFSSLLIKPWTLITYSFFHLHISHIFWNMLILYYAGSIFLNLFKKETFINVYFLGVLSGAIIFILSYSLFPVFKGRYPSMIGASAGVMAVMIFVCSYLPQKEVRLIFFNLKLGYIGLALVAIDLVMIPYGNSGGRISHLGGAALGFFYAYYLSNGTDIGLGFEKLWKKTINYFSKKKLNTVYKSSQDNNFSLSTKNPDQEKIDKILDKISVSGYESLSKDEKEILFRAGKE